MIFVDTSAWVEFLTVTGSEVCNTVDDLLGDDLAICDAISQVAATTNVVELVPSHLTLLFERVIRLIEDRWWRGWEPSVSN